MAIRTYVLVPGGVYTYGWGTAPDGLMVSPEAFAGLPPEELLHPAVSRRRKKGIPVAPYRRAELPVPALLSFGCCVLLDRNASTCR